MIRRSDVSGYQWDGAELTCAHAYLFPAVMRELARLHHASVDGGGLFDRGCGDGSVANELAKQGGQVTIVDPSTRAVAHASTRYPHLAPHEMGVVDICFGHVGRMLVPAKSMLAFVFARRA